MSGQPVEPAYLNSTLYQKRLDQWNDSFTEVHMGAIVYLIALIIVGVVGNVHVLYIYIAQFKPSTKRIFFILLSTMDLLACLIAMPFLVVDYTYHVKYEFVNVFFCKFFRFSNYVLTSGSTFVLLIVAIDKYKLICRPHGMQLSERQTKFACAMILLIDICVVCSPCLFLYGNKTIENKKYNISAVVCEIEESWENAYSVYIMTFSCIIVALVTSFAVLYSLIFKRLRKRGKFIVNVQVVPTVNRKTTKASTLPGATVADDDGVDFQDVPEIPNTSYDIIINHRNKKKQQEKREKRRMTLILCTLTSITALSWIPYVLLKTITVASPELFSSMSFTNHFVYHIFSLTPYLIMINAIVYSACDHLFRTELRVFYRRLYASLATLGRQQESSDNKNKRRIAITFKGLSNHICTSIANHTSRLSFVGVSKPNIFGVLGICEREHAKSLIDSAWSTFIYTVTL